MCIAAPGQVVKIKDGRATVQYSGETRDALTGGEKVKVGDYVLVQMGIVIQILSQKEARSSLTAWAQP